MTAPIECKIYLQPPIGFRPSVEVAACIYEFEDEILLLCRHQYTSQGNTWGVPGGKCEIGETPLDALVREMKEETGVIRSPLLIDFVIKLYCRHHDRDFVFHLFRTRFDEKPQIRLSPKEHIEAKWATLEESAGLPLIAGGHEMLEHYMRVIHDKRAI